MTQDGETEDSYYNNVSEMPEVPDVSILHCGSLAHHKMGIKLNNYKNIEDGTVGRILSYNDLSDRRERTKKKNSEDESEEDEEEEEHRRLQEEMERKRKEEEEEAEMRRLEAEALEEAERIRIEEEEERLADLQRGESNGETREMNQIFREASKKSRRESRRQSVDPGKVMYGRKEKEEERPVNKSYLGGKPIIVEDIIKLKTICWGGPKVIPRPEWMRSGIIFNPSKSVQSYGLNVLRGASKSFLLLVQAYILKHLLFHGKSTKKGSNHRKMKMTGDSEDKPKKKKSRENQSDSDKINAFNQNKLLMENLLKPEQSIQVDSLVGALTEIIWKCGDRKQGIVAVPGTRTIVSPTTLLLFDGVTEKIHLMHNSSEGELKSCVRKHIQIFMEEKGPGLASLLYSIVMSKGIDVLRSEMQSLSHCSLIDGGQDTVNLCLANLVLTGAATPWLHNGIISVRSLNADEEEDLEERVGITERNDIGLLMWNKDEEETAKLNMGSRYKTPNLPLWVSCVNGHWGVLFSPNKDLLKSENRFQIHYYSNFPMKERVETILTVDSRSKNINNNYADELDEYETEMTDPLEKVIQTKWTWAVVDWNGDQPYV